MATFGTAVKQEVNGTTIDQAVTCSGSDRVLAVAVWKTTASTLDTITYNGVSLTAISSALGTVNNDSIQWYRLIAPATGSNTLSLVVGGGGGYFGFVAVPISGADQTTPATNGVGTNGNGSPITLNVTSAPGKTVLAAFMLRHTGGGSSASVGAGQTTLELYSGNAESGAKSAGASYEAGDTSVTMSWTATNAGDWIESGFTLTDVTAVTGTARLVGGGRLVGGILLNGLVG